MHFFFTQNFVIFFYLSFIHINIVAFLLYINKTWGFKGIVNIGLSGGVNWLTLIMFEV